VTPPVTTKAPITPLTPTLQRVAQHLADTGARNANHLVILAHGWKLLPTDPAARSGASQ
jgi:hypothetical protein